MDIIVYRQADLTGERLKQMLTVRWQSIFLVRLVAAIFIFVTLPAYTQTPSGSSPESSDSVAPTKAPPADADLRSEVEQLKQLVREQQKRLDALDHQNPTPSTSADLSTTPSVERETSDSAAAAPATLQTASGPNNQYAGSSDERIRNLERQIKGLGPISFSGDIRLRAEPFFGGPSDESLDRMRGRIRARFNATADLGEQFRTGFSLATGDVNDPTSTNQTLTGFYTRKAVALDLAFVEFTPKEFKPLTVVGGKFRYPWFNTELTWDKDLNPEGAGETLAFNLNTSILKRFALVGFQLPFAELAGTSVTDKRITQAITYGGQLQTSWRLGSRLTLSAYSGYYDFRGSDSIAQALASASSKNPQTPFTGLLPLGTGNPVQDSTYTTTATRVVTIGGKAYPTGVTSVTAQFASKFGLFDNIARFDIDTGNPRFPIRFIGDYVQNTAACGNLANITPAPASSATQTFKQSVNAPCNSHYRRGYWAEGTVGRLEKKGDLQFGYAHIYIEREAVLGNFNYSDIRQGTNVTQHRFTAFYQFDPNIQLGFTALIGRPLGSSEPWLTRLQFDTIYIF
jgi:Putative porin